MKRTLKQKISSSVEHVKKHGVDEFISYKLTQYAKRLGRSWGFISAPIKVPKRILGVYDYKYFPWSLGDPMVFAEVLSVQKLKHDVEAVDICIVYDPDNPSNNSKEYAYIIKENAEDYILGLLPLFGTCPYLGSLYFFNSRAEYYRFLKMNAGRYVVYPDNLYLSENFYYAKYYIDEIRDFYHQNKYIPYLKVGGKYLSWARDFYARHLTAGEVPVVINLRRRGDGLERNAHPGIWLSFIDKIKEVFPEVKFIIVGTQEEIVPELENRKNVLFAKKLGTSMIEDCTLVRTSAMNMGMDSGIYTSAIFSDQPYVICQARAHEYYDLPEETGYVFSTDLQKYFSVNVPVTEEFLFKQFSEVYPKAKARLKDPVWRRQ